MSSECNPVTMFTYDGDGLRRETVTSAATTNFIWDGQDVLLETDAGNSTQVTYTQTPNIYGDLVSQRRGDTSKYYHFDALGSTLALTGSDEAVTDTYRYYAFGRTLTSSGNTVNNFRFVGNLGYYNESALALQYLRARYYQPSTGRFISRDPTPTFTSLYPYVANNPVNAIDASGKMPFCLPFWWMIEYIESKWYLDPSRWPRPNPDVTFLPDRIRTTWYWKKDRWWHKKTLCFEKDKCGDYRWVPKYKWVYEPDTTTTNHTLHNPPDPCVQTYEMFKAGNTGTYDYNFICKACCEAVYKINPIWVNNCTSSCMIGGPPIPGGPITPSPG